MDNMHGNYQSTRPRFAHTLLQPSQEVYTARSETSSSVDEETPSFPFVSTPSGNLKLNPRQVIYESNKLSIVAADPRRTKVNIKASSSDQDMSSMDNKQVRHMFSDEPQSARKTEGNCEETQIVKDLSLAKMGFTNKNFIDWKTVDLPPKTGLETLLRYRIANFINPDVLVKIANHEYRCHMLVLHCYSGYFEQLGVVSQTELSERYVTKNAFETIYRWMVDSGVDSYKKLGRHNILEIFTAAQFLQVKELEEQCWAFIDNEKLFSEDKAFMMYLEARSQGNTTIMELMVPRIQRFFLTLVSSKDFLYLLVDEVAIFLSSNYICIHSEMEVFMAGVRWLMHDWDQRKTHLVQVMSCVRFALISPYQLVDIRRNHENKEFLNITSDKEVSTMIDDGLAYATIKYYCGDEGNHEYGHCVQVLKLVEPTPRNWSNQSNPKDQKSYTSYQQFLQDLARYRLSHMEKSQKHGKGDMSSKPTCEGGDFYPDDMINYNKKL